MTSLSNCEIEIGLKKLVQSCVAQLNEYSEFSAHHIDPSVSELQILNSVNGSLEVQNNVVVSKVQMGELRCMIMDVYNVEISA